MSSFYVISDETTGSEVAIIALGGEVDFSAAPGLRERIFAHLHAGCRQLIIDLTDVTFIDSTAIAVLVGTVARLRSSGGGSVAVICPEHADSLSVSVPGAGTNIVREVFEVTGLDAGIALCGSREEAFAELALAG